MAALSDQSSMSSNSSFHSNSTLKSPSASPVGGGGRSRSFSISDILSDEVGSRKRSPPVVEQRGMPEGKHMRIEPGQQQQPLLTLGQAANVIISPINLTSPHPSLPSPHPNLAMHVTAPSFALGYTPSPFSYIPHPLTTPPRTISCSPFSGLTLTPTHPLPPPPQLNEAMFSDSLNLLSTVASQQQAMGNSSTTSDSSVLQNQLEAMRLHSHLNDSSISSNSSAALVDSSDDNASVTRRQSTPCILKHHRRKRREESSDSHMDLENTSRGCLSAEACHLSPTGPHFRSPLKPPNVTFSPSIFLSQPGGGVSSTVSYSPHQTSPSAEGGGGSRFITSTPIRAGDHRGGFTSPSYLNMHSPISASRRTESSECSSSGSDSEVPLLRRPRVPHRRKAKARTSLSPLLENAHSSQHIRPPAHPYPAPSTLLRSYSAYTPTSTHRLPEDSGVMADAPSHLMMTYPSPLHSALAPYHVDSGLGQPHTSYSSHSIHGYPSKWAGHSPVTDHFKKTGQIQSVPPWFICSDKKSDGKRLRLREAINKSLSETTSNTSSQLPPEWKVYAYGQTADQKDLTQKARSFLRCRPRVLKFDHAASSPVAHDQSKPLTSD